VSRRRGRPSSLPQTRAEMIAYQLGEELARNPELRLQPPETPFAAGMVAMSDERISAAADLGWELFNEWVTRGGRHVVAAQNHD
jgi:hypothetical protein